MSFTGIKKRLEKAQELTPKERMLKERKKLEEQRKKIHRLSLRTITKNKLNPTEAIVLMYVIARDGNDTSITRMGKAFYGHIEDVKMEVRRIKKILKKLKEKSLIDFKERTDVVNIEWEIDFEEGGLYLEYRERDLLNTPCRTCSLILIYMNGWKRANKEWIRVPNVKIAKDLGISERTVASTLKKLDSMLIIKRNTYFKTRYIYIGEK